MSDSPLLTVEDLHVTYNTPTGLVQAVKGVSFELGREKLGIVGESGSGKSQTGRAILGLTAPGGEVRAKKLEFEGVDLLHARSRAPAWSALKAARRTGVPFVTTCHSPYGHNWLKHWYNGVMVKGDRVIAISEFVAGEMRRRYKKLGDDAITVIPRGVDRAVARVFGGGWIDGAGFGVRRSFTSCSLPTVSLYPPNRRAPGQFCSMCRASRPACPAPN